MQERSAKYSRHADREERQRTGGSKIGNFNIFTNEPITECPITGNIEKLEANGIFMAELRHSKSKLNFLMSRY